MDTFEIADADGVVAGNARAFAGTPARDAVTIAGGNRAAAARPLAALAAALKRENVRYCVLHGWRDLPEGNGGDFDIAIEPRGLAVVERALERDCGAAIVQLLRHEHTGFFFVARDAASDEFVLVDAALDYRRDGRVYLTGERMLAGAREWNGFQIAAPEVEFAYLLIKKISKLALPARQRDRLAELDAELGERAPAIALELFGDRWGARLTDWIATGDWSVIAAHGGELRSALRRHAVARDPLNPLRYWMHELARRWRRWREPAGLMVAVMGPDGAGKSTLIEGLGAALGGAFRRRQTFHLRPALFRQRAEGPPVTDPHGAPPRGLLPSIAKIVLYGAEYSCGYALRLRPALARSTLLIADRYYDDLLIDPRRYRYGGPPWLARLGRRFAPRPDLWLVLDAPEAQLLARKREVAPEELRRQRAAYRELAGAYGNAVLLDAAGPPDAVVRGAAAVCADLLRARYQDRRPGWLPGARRETLDWLAGALLKRGRARFDFAASGPAEDSFVWFNIGDGRGVLLPLDPAMAARAVDLYAAHSQRGRALKRLLRTAARRGLARRILRRVAVRTEAGNGDEASLFAALRRRLGRDRLGFAVSIGTPGPDRKPVVQALDHAGAVVAYAKIGANPASNALVRNESATLARLSGAAALTFDFPRLLDAGQWNGNDLCVQSAPERPLAPAPEDFDGEYLETLIALSRIDSYRAPLTQSGFWQSLRERIAAVRHPYYRPALERGCALAAARLGSSAIDFHFAHGDFVPWNIRRDGRRLYLFDWEYARADAPAGWDLFHWFVQSLSLVKRRAAGAIWRDLGAGEAARWMRDYCGRLDLDYRLSAALFALYAAGNLVQWADAAEADTGKLTRLATLLNLAAAELEAA